MSSAAILLKDMHFLRGLMTQVQPAVALAMPLKKIP